MMIAIGVIKDMVICDDGTVLRLVKNTNMKTHPKDYDDYAWIKVKSQFDVNTNLYFGDYKWTETTSD